MYSLVTVNQKWQQQKFCGFFSTRHFVQSVVKKGTPLGSMLPPLVENDLNASTSQGEMNMLTGHLSQVLARPRIRQDVSEIVNSLVSVKYAFSTSPLKDSIKPTPCVYVTT